MINKVLVINEATKISQLIIKKLREREIYSLLVNEDEVVVDESVVGIIEYTNNKLDVNVPVLTLNKIQDIDDQIDEFIVKNSLKKLDIDEFKETAILNIRKEVGKEKVILGLSGGVDSTVVAALLSVAIGENLTCILVDHGLMRKGEVEQVRTMFETNFKSNLIVVDAEKRFLDKLKGITDPEQKRKTIGNEFVKVFEEEKNKLSNVAYLAQGTIYPDIIESGMKNSEVIKSHHNVGGLPEEMALKLLEPVKYLFKDEVRKLGKSLKLPNEAIYRQPFPGPGLGIRVLGEITKEQLDILKECDFIYREELKKAHLEYKIWQYFAVLTPLKTVGVRNGKRTYENVLVLRAVNSVDGMSAYVYPLDYKLLNTIVERITNEVAGVNRVVYDITPKPSGTIEWE